MEILEFLRSRTSELTFIGLIIGFALGLVLIQPVLVPVLISFTLYALLEPISDTLYRMGMRRSYTAFICMLVLLVISSLIVLLVVPELVMQLGVIQSQLGHLEGIIGSVFENINLQLANWGVNSDLSSSKDLFQKIRPQLDLATVIASSNIMIAIIFTAVLVPLFTFFLIRDFKTLRKTLLGTLPNRYFELGWLIYYRVAYQLQRYVRGILLQSLLVGLISGIGFYIVGFKTPFLLGAIAGMLNVIPYIGMILAMTPPVLISLTATPFEPQFVVSAILVIVITQLIDNIFIIPTVIAHAVSLHPLTVIAGVIIFGNAFGMLGMVMAIPVLAALKIIYVGLQQGLKHEPAKQFKFV
jgi:predicted PurR-regulated permease PerM